ncbi:MAG: zinc-dependent alcohol dehydrogenase family protein [Calditrichaeota bacterium]|nr:zinc-dependent alcohol dehydrogenase family protein [Calditrichota bacterium]
MKAVYYEQFNQPLKIETVADPSPGDSSVVLKVEATGMCLSDWHGWRGHDPDIVLPHVPGHELAGVIVETGKSIKRWKIGDRVTVPFVGGCGHCEYCHSGNQQICDNQFQPGFTAWGSFAEYVRIDYADENLVRLPDDMDFSTAASLGCRFITAFRGVVAQGKLHADQWIAVHGCGGVGLSAIMIAKAFSAKIIAIDINSEKLNFAKSIGADFLINAKTDPVVESITKISHGGVHVSVDALGHTETASNSIRCLRKQGKHIQIGLMTESHSSLAVPMSQVLANELEIIGSHGMQAHRYDEIFQLIQSGKLEPQRLIGKKIKLEDSVELLPKMDEFSDSGIIVVDRF